MLLPERPARFATRDCRVPAGRSTAAALDLPGGLPFHPFRQRCLDRARAWRQFQLPSHAGAVTCRICRLLCPRDKAPVGHTKHALEHPCRKLPMFVMAVHATDGSAMLSAAFG